MNKTILSRLLLFWLTLFLFEMGCVGESAPAGDNDDSSQDDDDDNGDDDDDDSGDDDDDSSDDDDDSSDDDDDDDDSDTDTNPCKDELAGDYSTWREDGNDDMAPGVLVTIVDESHPGWLEARCSDCHGKGQPYQPTTFHDPKMDCWAWSCARGFPGGECHGHGPNTDAPFNHNLDINPDFKNCTRAGCHDTPFGTSFNDNHGFNDAPDALCNACHDRKWTEWPDDINKIGARQPRNPMPLTGR